MMEDISLEKFRAKGWSPAEIEKTRRILARGAEDKPPVFQFFDKLAYWIAMMLAIVGNLILSVVLVPFLVIMSSVPLYLTLVLLGFAFGALFNILIQTIERLQKETYIVAGMFIPSVALVNVYVMTYLANKLIPLLQLNTPLHSPVIVSVIYVFAFTSPYLISNYRKQKALKPAR